MSEVLNPTDAVVTTVVEPPVVPVEEPKPKKGKKVPKAPRPGRTLLEKEALLEELRATKDQLIAAGNPVPDELDASIVKLRRQVRRITIRVNKTAAKNGEAIQLPLPEA